jgi:thiamine-monophosphate kinase
LAKAIREHAHAAMDVSDGLAGDLAKLCEASGVSAVIEASGIPLSTAAATLLDRGTIGVEAIVSGGDDYEILCAIPQANIDSFKQAAQTAGIAITVIGKITAGSSSPCFINKHGDTIALHRLSYSHF